MKFVLLAIWKSEEGGKYYWEDNVAEYCPYCGMKNIK